MKVNKFMSKKTVAFRAGDNLDKVIKTLSRNNISGCPVVDSRQNVIGMVSQSDVIKLIDVFGKINSGSFSDFVTSLIKENKIALGDLRNTKVEQFYTRNPITVDHDAELYDAVRLMDRHDIERLPVVKNKKLVGVISKSDLIKALDKMDKM